MNLTYRTIIEPDTKGFHGFVPALPGCHTWGKTISDTQKHLREAILVYLEDMAKNGETIPRDSSLESFESVELVKSARTGKVRWQYA